MVRFGSTGFVPNGLPTGLYQCGFLHSDEEMAYPICTVQNSDHKSAVGVKYPLFFRKKVQKIERRIQRGVSGTNSWIDSPRSPLYFLI